jgi:signal transduction histidine kinase
MVRALSMGRREFLALSRAQIREISFRAARLDLSRILLDRHLHAALALLHLALAVALSLAAGEVIGPLASSGLCLSAGAVALMLMLRAAESPPSSRAAHPTGVARRDSTLSDLAKAGTRTMECAKREVSALLALMNHELRTPLNAILGNAELIRHEILGPAGTPHYRDSAGQIMQGGQNLLRATEDMLSLTSALATATFTSHQPVDLELLVRDILLKATPAAKRRNIALSWQSLTDRSVLSEPTALEHALGRIIDGALAQADDGAGIHVDLTPCHNSIELMITLSHGHPNMVAAAAGRADCGADRGPAALEISVARTLAALLGTHLHTAYGIDGRWRAIIELPTAPAH